MLPLAAKRERRLSEPASASGQAREALDDGDLALEALFDQLERDLEADDLAGGSEDDDDDMEDFSEEEMAQLELELQELFGSDGHDGDAGLPTSSGSAPSHIPVQPGIVTQGPTAKARDDGKPATSGAEVELRPGERPAEDSLRTDEQGTEVEEAQPRKVHLARWQLKKLADAARQGRRHTNVKTLAAELHLSREDVLAWLRDPPDLQALEVELEAAGQAAQQRAMSARAAEEERQGARALPQTPAMADEEENLLDEQQWTPHLQRQWHSQKRLRREHLATFERVYGQSHHPSESMVQNLVQLTHVPRQRILQWFQERRQQPRRQGQV
eukprot:SM000214S06766  [mRNA]  locus=s214:79844:81217:+ [translate_table: standard]